MGKEIISRKPLQIQQPYEPTDHLHVFSKEKLSASPLLVQPNTLTFIPFDLRYTLSADPGNYTYFAVINSLGLAATGYEYYWDISGHVVFASDPQGDRGVQVLHYQYLPSPTNLFATFLDVLTVSSTYIKSSSLNVTVVYFNRSMYLINYDQDVTNTFAVACLHDAPVALNVLGASATFAVRRQSIQAAARGGS